MDDKIITTNRSALRAKYGPAGFDAIRKAVGDLVAADANQRELRVASREMKSHIPAH